MKRLASPENISNPRDFLETKVPELSDLDSLLRCHICKDFLKTSVLTPCGHSFCSICIRKYLQQESKCPLCLTELTESMLQKEFLVQEICAGYAKLREKLIDQLKIPVDIERLKSEEIILPDDESSTDIEVVSQKRPFHNTTSSPNINKKRKPSGITSLLMKKTDMKQVKTAQCPICSKYLPLSELEGSHIDECLNQETSLERSDSFEILEEQTRPPTPEEKAPQKKAPEKILSYHNDRYLSSGFKQQTENRLPRLDFQSLSTTQLKQKLTNLGIPYNGSKQQLIARYKHYEMLWNSNFLDSIEPVDETELKRRLASWENKHNSDHPTNSTSITNLIRGGRRDNLENSMLKSFKTDKFDRKGWMRYHASAFKELKAEAMASKYQAKVQEGEDSNSKDE